MDKNILTIATGKKLYIDMAINLARSFWLWNAENKINFYLATDQPEGLTADVKSFVTLIIIRPGELGEGFSTKLHLDKLAPEGQTLFIDSDCLIYGDLTHVFERFKGHKVAVVGSYISSGEWFGNIGEILKHFNIQRIPKFNGGVYYLEKSKTAEDVLEMARSLEKQYDGLGFVRLRNRPNDEVLMALAMELNKQPPIADDGSILAEFVNFQSGIKSDLLKGKAELYNNPDNSNYQKNWQLTIARPLIVHFLGHHNQIMPYIKEVKQLEYITKFKFPKNAAILLTLIFITMPFYMGSVFKSMLRPFYHLLFGTRKIKTSERVI